MKRKLNLVIALFLAGILFSVFLPGCAKKQETIKIVTSLPMQEITVGKEIVNGIKLALEEVDYKVGNYKIELVVEDGGDEKGQWQESIEEDIAKRAVQDSDVMVYLGTYNSGAAMVSIPITNKAGLVQISPGNTMPGLTQPGFIPGQPGIFYPTGVRNYFRVVPTDALQGPVGAIWAKELGFNNIYIFDDGEAYGTGIANLFEATAEEIGLNIVGRQILDPTQDIAPVLEELKDKDIGLIYFGGITVNGAGPLARNIKELKLGAAFMGPDGILNQDFINLAGSASEGTYVTTVGLPPKKLSETTQKGQLFYNKYRDEYAIEPETFSAFGYEAAKVALLAIERAGTKDRARILEEVSKIKDYDGLFGTWSFDENGDTSLTIIIVNIVQNGIFVFEKLETGNVYEIIKQIRSSPNRVKQ